MTNTAQQRAYRDQNYALAEIDELCRLAGMHISDLDQGDRELLLRMTGMQQGLVRRLLQKATGVEGVNL